MISIEVTLCQYVYFFHNPIEYSEYFHFTGSFGIRYPVRNRPELSLNCIQFMLLSYCTQNLNIDSSCAHGFFIYLCVYLGFVVIVNL